MVTSEKLTFCTGVFFSTDLTSQCNICLLLAHYQLIKRVTGSQLVKWALYTVKAAESV